ncbi:NifZ protein [Rubrivivax sp. A210]|uniref:nitrogen fixation protein NifZ n=1 Tax=Rubrivivax sp. A210 TaxID=2772301 RepID=UPI00191B7210|nr:nitrogen fixation protein NifZ [Rubrivivax sp. A210]CAD5371938.1 NifZ protein [Rubrivivax sp. A210]
MIDLPDPDAARYQWGQAVFAADHLFNDGSFPDAPLDALLVAAGGPGEIVQVGLHEESRQPVYMVDFGVAVLGCLEEELAPAPLLPS